jgi:hypothetical protein
MTPTTSAQLMETNLALAILLAPLTLGTLALLLFGSRHIHRQMDDIVGAAKVRSSARPRPE